MLEKSNHVPDNEERHDKGRDVDQEFAQGRVVDQWLVRNSFDAVTFRDFAGEWLPVVVCGVSDHSRNILSREVTVNG